MLRHYSTVALRNLGGQRLHSAITILVLALGLTCFLAAALFVLYLAGFERQFASSGRTYVIYQATTWTQVGLRTTLGKRSGFALAARLKSELPALAVARQITLGTTISVDGGNAKVRGVSATDSDWLDMFDLTVLAGDTRGALARQNTAVITASTAMEMFGSTDVVGRTLTFTGEKSADVAVAAVVADVEGQSYLAPGVLSNGIGILASWDVIEKVNRALRDDSMVYGTATTYVMLPADGSVSLRELNERLEAFERGPFVEQGATIELEAHPVTSIAADDLQRNFEGFQSGARLPFTIAGVVTWLAALVLCIGCLNFVNLMTARSMGRAREVGVRKSVGATSTQIVTQNLLQTAFIVLVGIVLALLLLTAVVHLTESRWRVLVQVPWSQPPLWGLLVAVLAGVSVAAGSYPAAVLARVHPAAALRLGTMRSGPRLLRTLLVVAQVGAAVFLGVVMLVMLGQAKTLRAAMLGRYADPYVVMILPLSTLRQTNIDVVTNEFLRSPAITGATASASYPFQTANITSRRLSRSAVNATGSSNYQTQFVGYDYFSVMQIPLLAGRAFSREYSDDWLPANPQEAAASERRIRLLIDRRAARSLGWVNPEDAVGEVVFSGANSELQEEIIGVVETVPMTLREQESDGLVYQLNLSQAQVVTLRIAATDTEAAFSHIDAVWKRLVPDSPLQRLFLDEAFATMYRFYTFAGRVISGLAAVAVVIAAIGLFGMAAYVTRRRTREIGLRKSQGASPRQILRLLLWDFTKPVLLGNLIAWPFAVIAARTYVGLFSAQLPLTPAPFILALIGSLLVAWLAVGGFVWRAARVNPTAALREE